MPAEEIALLKKVSIPGKLNEAVEASELRQGNNSILVKTAAVLLAGALAYAAMQARLKSVKTNPPARERFAAPSAWPSVSVIIPSYNQGRYIERTLRSILNQDYPGPVEVIVSDGGSTDETVEVLRKYPQVRWWSEKDEGYVDAVNKGLKAATGEIVAIQSSDDYYLESAFVKAVSRLRDDDSLVFVTGNDVLIGDHRLPFFPPPKPYVTLMNPGAQISRTPHRHVQQHCTFIRRSAVDGLGGLRAEVDLCADFDLWYRALHFGRAVALPDYLAVYQVHPSQRTKNNAGRWTQTLGKVVEDAEADPQYARRFVPTPEMKRDIYRQWDIFWNNSAGGEEGAQKARALARETLQQADLWPDYVRDFAEEYAPDPPAPKAPSRIRQAAEAARSAFQYNTLVRAMAGKPPYPRYAIGPNKQLIDFDWWKESGGASA